MSIIGNHIVYSEDGYIVNAYNQPEDLRVVDSVNKMLRHKLVIGSELTHNTKTLPLELFEKIEWKYVIFPIHRGLLHAAASRSDLSGQTLNVVAKKLLMEENIGEKTEMALILNHPNILPKTCEMVLQQEFRYPDGYVRNSLLKNPYSSFEVFKELITEQYKYPGTYEDIHIHFSNRDMTAEQLIDLYRTVTGDDETVFPEVGVSILKQTIQALVLSDV